MGLDHALRRDDSAGHPAEPALHRGRAVHAEDAHHRLLPPAQPQPARHPRRGALRPLHPRLGDHRADVELRVAGTDLPVEFSPFEFEFDPDFITFDPIHSQTLDKFAKL